MTDAKESNDEWWNSLTQEEREQAFRAVSQRIFQSILCDQLSYKDVVTDVFGCEDSDVGMECGYYAIHNAVRTDYK